MNINDTVTVVPESSQFITREKLKKFLPKGSSVQVTDEVLDIINKMETDTGMPQDMMEENVMSYMHLIGGSGGIGLREYVNAVKYCTIKRNRTNREAWAIVFPAKYEELRLSGKPVDNFVSMYNNSKMVVAIDKAMIIPAWVQYSSYNHFAIKKQYELATNDNVSAMVQHLAAKELYVMTKMPEDKTIEFKIGASDAVLAQQQEMNNTLAALVANQSRMFASGMQPADIQKVHTITLVETEDVVLDEDDE